MPRRGTSYRNKAGKLQRAATKTRKKTTARCSKPKYVPKPCMICASTSGFTCAACRNAICHSCVFDVKTSKVFDPDTDLGNPATRPSKSQCPACRNPLCVEFEPAPLWVSKCAKCQKPFSAATKDDAILLLEMHARDDCPAFPFAPCVVAREDLAAHLEHCTRPDCLRMKKWMSVARRLTHDKQMQESEIAVLEHEVWELRRKFTALKETLGVESGINAQNMTIADI